MTVRRVAGLCVLLLAVGGPRPVKGESTSAFVGEGVEAESSDERSTEEESSRRPNDPAQGSAELQGVEEIIVSAPRPSTDPFDAPQSVTVLDERTLRDTGVERLDEIQGLVPNLQFLTGRSDQEASVFIRGVGALPRLYFDPGVAIYVDGVLISRAFGQLIDVLDIENIEVLRGPQGTRGGRNTVGGAIEITTVKPGPEQEASGLVRVGNRERVETSAVVNTPVPLLGLEEMLFARLSFASANFAGFTKNTLTEEEWSDENALAFLGGLRFVPSESVDFTIQGSWSRDHNRSRGGRCVLVPTTEQTLAPSGYDAACQASMPFRFQADVEGLSDLESYGAWGTLAWRLPPTAWFSGNGIRLLAGWREQIPATREDLDMTGLPVLALSSGVASEPRGQSDDARQITAEMQVFGRTFGERISLLAGVFAFWEDARESQILRVLPDENGALFTQVSSNSIDNSSWALYATGDVALTEAAHLEVGLRYTEETKALVRRATRSAEPPTLLIDGKRGYSAWTPSATLSIEGFRAIQRGVVERLLAYFTYARGFKAGGFNGGAQLNGSPEQLEPFAPEFLDSLELGFKAAGFGGRVQASVALFQGFYSDLQVQTLGFSGTAASVLIENAADARTRGLEVELFAEPFEGLSVAADLGLLDTRYDEFVGTSALANELVDRAGESFPFVPPIQAHAAISYVLPIDLPPWFPGPDGARGALVPRIDWYYEGEVFHWGPELRQAVQPGYNRIDARLALEFAGGRGTAALWGRNLTDETYFSDVISIGVPLVGSLVRYYQEPIAFGVELSYRL